jgi:hypothetical protein
MWEGPEDEGTVRSEMERAFEAHLVSDAADSDDDFYVSKKLAV